MGEYKAKVTCSRLSLGSISAGRPYPRPCRVSGVLVRLPEQNDRSAEKARYARWDNPLYYVFCRRRSPDSPPLVTTGNPMCLQREHPDRSGTICQMHETPAGRPPWILRKPFTESIKAKQLRSATSRLGTPGQRLPVSQIKPVRHHPHYLACTPVLTGKAHSGGLPRTPLKSLGTARFCMGYSGEPHGISQLVGKSDLTRIRRT